MSDTIHIDYVKMATVLRRMMEEPSREVNDIYLAALREVTGLPELGMTPETRRYMKTMFYGVMYSAASTPESIGKAMSRQSIANKDWAALEQDVIKHFGKVKNVLPNS